MLTTPVDGFVSQLVAFADALRLDASSEPPHAQLAAFADDVASLAAMMRAAPAPELRARYSEALERAVAHAARTLIAALGPATEEASTLGARVVSATLTVFAKAYLGPLTAHL